MSEMAEAVRRTNDLARESGQKDRREWTHEQWCEDAERLMDHPDGSVFCLLNGHALSLIHEWRRHKDFGSDKFGDQFRDWLHSVLVELADVVDPEEGPVILAYGCEQLANKITEKWEGDVPWKPVIPPVPSGMCNCERVQGIHELGSFMCQKWWDEKYGKPGGGRSGG